MSEPCVSTRDHGWFAEVIIDQPARKNALSAPVIEGLYEAVVAAVERFEAGRAPRVLVIRGAGGIFAAGADIKQMADSDEVSLASYLEQGQRFISMLLETPMTTVAVVEGLALGGGFELALACDTMLVEAEAKLGLPEVTLGIVPAFAGTQLLGTRLSPARARYLIQSGALISGKDAENYGLAVRSFARGEADQALGELLAPFKRVSPDAMRAAKQCVRASRKFSLREGLALEGSNFRQLARENGLEGMHAFVEKRPAAYVVQD